MHRHPRWIGLGLCALALATPGCAALAARAGAHASPPPAPRAVMSEGEVVVFEATNAERRKAGLSPLVVDATLVAIARKRSRDMAARAYFSHVTPEGTDVFALMRVNRVAFAAAGENLARNNYAPAEAPGVAMKGWLKSAGHRANLLNTAFGHLGVGMATAKDGEVYLTQVFTD